jgi:hypothetical protein
MTPPSIAAQKLSTIRTMSRSWSTITGGGLAWPRAKRDMMIWRSGSPKARSSAYRPSPWKGTPMALRILSPPPTPRCSQENIRTEPSKAASGTIWHRKPHNPLPKRSSTSRLKADRRKGPADRPNRRDPQVACGNNNGMTKMRNILAFAALLVVALLALAQFGPPALFGG